MFGKCSTHLGGFRVDLMARIGLTHQKILAELTGVGVNLNIFVFRLRSLISAKCSLSGGSIARDGNELAKWRRKGHTNWYRSMRIGTQT
jgi:hypothetical protein